KINRIIAKMISGQEATFYELTFLSKDVTVLVPTRNALAVGIRPLSSNEHVREIFRAFVEPTKRFDCHDIAMCNWNKRHKEYKKKMATGSLKDLLEIYFDLRFIATQKE